MHTIHFDRDHVDKIREAAMRRVDFDTDTYRPSVLRKINLQATTSPRKQKKKNEIPKKYKVKRKNDKLLTNYN